MRPVRWLLVCFGLLVFLSGGWASPPAPAAAGTLLINEIDAITADEAAEFVELYDGGAGHTSLDGLTLVLYRGDYATVYLAVSLGGFETDGAGYFVAGGLSVAPDLAFAANQFRDGPDAVALYAAPRSQFPPGSPVVVDALIDAVVYAPGGQATPGLEALLLPGEAPVDEGQRGAAGEHAAQRFPNGAGQPLQTSVFAIAPPTPHAPNTHIADVAPAVVSFAPAADATDVGLAASIEVTFSEPVTLSDALEIACDGSGAHSYTTRGGPLSFTFQPRTPLGRDERCDLTLFKDRVSDVDEDDPPDNPLASLTWSFTTEAPYAENVLINEIDADTAGADAAEFIELYDGGNGHTPLGGLLVVLFNGSDDLSYRTVDLDGFATDAAGYFLLANAAVAGADLVLPDGALQNGPDAAALVAGRLEDYPNGTPVSGVAPLDAVVYGPGGQPDAGLLPLLNGGQAAVDENGRGQAESHSNQRCPNGAGGARNTHPYRQNTPTPGAASDCVTDSAPSVTGQRPAPGADGVSVSTALTITFSEPVAVAKGWLTLVCTTSGAHPYAGSGGPTTFTVQPNAPLAPAETCTATVKAQAIKDVDDDDPPDTPSGDVTWRFSTAAAPADFLLINEIDPDTAGSDTAEFIELYDGGEGRTPLDGLVLVFYNGSSNTSYRALDLDGQRTDANGYWRAGNAATTPDLVFADGGLQNGPDAVALYAGDAAQFPSETPLHTSGLMEAVVYGDAANAPGLLPLLLPGESGALEGARGAAEQHSLQRCPNGAGGQRRTAAFRPNPPTPDAPSVCTSDVAPAVSGVLPASGANAVAVDTALTVTFSEPVTPDGGWLRLRCGGNDYATATAPAGANGFTATPTTPLPHATTCQATVRAAYIHDADSDDPPDVLAADFVWSFTTAAPVAGFVLINELDSDTPGNDTAEFVELYDGGAGDTALDGLALVFFNGQDDRVYYAVDLDGAQTDAAGYAIAGSAALGGAITLPAAALQNGPDAVALYEGDGGDFPAGAPLTTAGLLDAAVYGTADPTDAGLLPLLAAGEPQIDEAARGAAETDSSGRCPNGAGGQRHTATYRQNPPTPGAANDCHTDAAPAVLVVTPANGAIQVATDTALSITFSEPVTPAANWLSLRCAGNDYATTIAASGSSGFLATPTATLPHGAACLATVKAALVHDADSDDPPDAMAADFTWSFTVVAAPVADFVVINELDSDTPGNDTAEFVELYDGGVGQTSLSGLALVLYNGQDDRVYYAADLAGLVTDEDGYAVLGSASLGGVVTLPAAVLQNGPDAAVLYEGSAADFPIGSSLTTTGELDAVVYGTADPADSGLLTLLAAGEPQIDEAARGAADTDSSGRCPNGAGGQRHTAAYRPDPPTPGAANDCHVDAPPAVVSVQPAAGETQVAADAVLTVRFSEPVTPSTGWLSLRCGDTDYAMTIAPSGGSGYTATPTAPLPHGATCRATVAAALVHDADSDDPPDAMAADFTWSFAVVSAPVADFVLINELDSDTPGNDRAEFVELYDGGLGGTALQGLVLVLFNGQDDRAYYAVDLDGAQTDAAGYALIGSAALRGAVTLPNALLQNGPDAVALYKGHAADFPVGAALTTAGLLDAAVYGTADPTDSGLLSLLAAGEQQIDEAARGTAETDSDGRCPNGTGGQRHTATYRPDPPTPGAANDCHTDAAPGVLAVTPADGAAHVASDATLAIAFSEPVTPSPGWLSLRCGSTDYATAIAPSGDSGYTATPTAPLPHDATCRATIAAALIHDADSDDPPDALAADFVWSFTTAAPVADFVLINEIDSDTPGRDTAEFIELYDGGGGQTSLSGLALVLYNGQDDRVYYAVDLDGLATNEAGYAVVGSAALGGAATLPAATVQNGPDAIALYAGDAGDFAGGAPLTTTDLLDAVVYGPAGEADAGLLPLLAAGQPQVDEGGRGDAAAAALARCPNGQGGPRHTEATRPVPPTPGQANVCPFDQAPAISATEPPPEANDVPLTATLTITFSEGVQLSGTWVTLVCQGVAQAITTLPGDQEARVVPAAPLPAGARCVATVLAAGVADADADDPPDHLTADYQWQFDTVAAPPPLLAGFSSNSPVWVDEAVVFANTTTGPGAPVYLWDFGDGHGSTLAQPSHRYAAPGTYLVTLTASTTQTTPPQTATATGIVVVRPRLVFAPVVVHGPR